MMGDFEENIESLGDQGTSGSVSEQGSSAQSPASKPGFQIGMRQMLVGLLVGGSAIGLWGRLYISEPQMAFLVLSLGSVMLPFLGAILLIFQLAKRADSPATVRTLATVLLVTPVIGLTIAAALQSQHFQRVGVNGLSAMTNAELIEKELPGQVFEPWVWDELESRLARGDLSAEESENAVRVLLDEMQQVEGGYDQPLSWQGDFVGRAVKSGVDVELPFQIYETYIRKDAMSVGRVRESNRRLSIDLRFKSTWSSQLGFGFDLLSAVGEVRVNGEKVDYENDYRFKDEQAIALSGPFTPGEMNVEVDIIHAFVSDDELVGLNWETLPPGDWPDALKQWTTTHVETIQVLGQNEQLVELVEGASKPRIRVGRALVQPVKNQREGERATTLKIVFEPIEYDLPIAFRVIAKAGDRTFEFPGSLTTYSTEKYSRSRLELQTQLKEPLPEDCQSLDLRLVPAPKSLDNEPTINKMFGGELNYYSVPLERFDGAQEQ